MSITATYSIGNPVPSAQSGGALTATQTLTYALSGDGVATSFAHDVLLAGAANFGLGVPTGVTATITKQQTSGFPGSWAAGTVYALNKTIAADNGTLQKVTTAGTSFGTLRAANTAYSLNQQVLDLFANLQTCIVAGTTGTSTPTNFVNNMPTGVQTQDGSVTWQCAAADYPPFTATLSATFTDGTVVWTGQGTNNTVAGFDAPIVTPTLTGSVLTLSFNEALKAPGAQTTDTFGNVFTYTAWNVVVTLSYTGTASSAISNQQISAQTAAWTSGTAQNTALTLNTNGLSTVVANMVATGSLTGGQIQFEVTIDGSTWFGIQGGFTNIYNALPSWIPANGNLTFQFNVAGYVSFRARVGTTLVGSGTLNVLLQASPLSCTPWTVIGQSNASFLNATAVNGGTSNTSAAAWTSGTALNTAIVLLSTTQSFDTLLLTFNQTSTITAGAVTFECSNDNSNWFTRTGVDASNYGSDFSIYPLQANIYKVIKLNLGGFQYFRVRLSTAITGTGTVTVGYAAVNSGYPLSQVQQLKDSGRTYVALSGTLLTGVTTEALATFTKNVNGTNTTAQTAYTITNGKTFRIQALSVQILNTTTVANNCIYNVRAAASVGAASPLVTSCAASAVGAVAGQKGFASLSIPDGMELLGNGTLQIGVSHLENVTTAAISSFILNGYEY